VLVAITRPVPKSINRCELTHLSRAPIDFARATAQHEAYERALAGLGCTIQHLPALDEMPDSVFVEDAAVVLPEVAIITRPGAKSRRGEVESVEEALRAHRSIRRIGEPGVSLGNNSSRARRPTAAGETPALLDGGDVLRIGETLFVGRSMRTNDAGIEQLHAAVEPHGYVVITIDVRECLHLKSAVTYVGGAILCNRQWIDAKSFGGVDVIDVHPDEPYAANALFVNGSVLYPGSYPRTRERMEQRGMKVRVVDADELAKAEGGVTCCSIIYKQ